MRLHAHASIPVRLPERWRGSSGAALIGAQASACPPLLKQGHRANVLRRRYRADRVRAGHLQNPAEITPVAAQGRDQAWFRPRPRPQEGRTRPPFAWVGCLTCSFREADSAIDIMAVMA